MIDPLSKVERELKVAEEFFGLAKNANSPFMRAYCRRVASYVDRLLRGEKPGDLPVQLPTKFEMAVNRKTANALGLSIPPSILLRADEVIE